MANFRSQSVNLPGAQPLMNPLQTVEEKSFLGFGEVLLDCEGGEERILLWEGWEGSMIRL